MKRALMALCQMLVVAILLLCSGCLPRAGHELRFDPKEYLRIAVLPVQKAPALGESSDQQGRSTPWPRSDPDSPTGIVERSIERELTGTNFEIVPAIDVEKYLAAAGIKNLQPNDDPNSERALQNMCSDLGCDAWLSTTIVRWSQRYLGIQTINRIKLRIQITRARDVQNIFTSSAEDFEVRGVTRGVTGYPALVFEPLRGLGGELIRQLAQRAVRTSLTPLLAESQPEYETAPALKIFRVAHSAADGVIDGPVMVFAEGTSGLSASFAIGKEVRGVPMFEVGPGRYVGEYIALSDECFQGLELRVTLFDWFGRQVTETVRPAISSSPRYCKPAAPQDVARK